MNDHFIAFRTKRKLNKAQAAALLGVNKSTYLRWENGDTKVSFENLDKVESVTGIPRAKLRPDIVAVMRA